MLTPSYLRTVVRKVSTVLALLLALQALQPGLRAGAAVATSRSAGAGLSAVHTSTGESGTALLQSQALPTSAPTDMARATLDLVVRRSFDLLGWRVTSITNGLDWAKVQYIDNLVTGTAPWQIEVMDDKAQSLSLTGTLAFNLEESNNSSQGPFSLTDFVDLPAGASGIFTSTFQGNGLELALDAGISSTRNGSIANTEGHFNLSLSRNGQTNNVKSTTTVHSRQLAYGLLQFVSTSSVERDGTRAESSQTTTIRDLGKGESEIWLDTSANTATGTSMAIRSSRHFFQRILQSHISQYVDRFELTTTDNKYTLAEPTTISGTLGGDFDRVLPLVDKDGKPLNAGSGAQDLGSETRGPGLHSPMPASGIPAGHLEGVVRQTSGAVQCPSCSDYAREAALVVVAAGITVLILGPVGVAAFLLVSGETTAGAFLAGATVTVSGGWLGYLGNADPYFIFPDIRPNNDPVDPSPLQITRVTGGLVTTIPTATLALSTTAGVTTTVQAGDDIYDDNPVPFVGGEIPSGAKAIGAWEWDRARSYGAVPSHTQARSSGPQIHYFINASNPLNVGTEHNVIQYVYLDPDDPPQEIYLQFYTRDGDGERRAYWGADLVQTGGEAGSPALFPMGALPAAGGWMRLQIPAYKLGLAGNPVNGILYGTYGGKTWWGSTTTADYAVDNAPSIMPVDDPPTLLTTTQGSQIAFRLAKLARLDIEIVDRQGKPVRTLLAGEERTEGYQVVIWDAKDNDGKAVEDAAYTARFSVDGKVVAERGVTITPFVANITTPGPYSVVRGDQVPVIGEAYGDHFSSYLLEYGEGLNPSSWQTITTSSAPALRPTGQLRLFNPGNIANWNVGIDEFKPWDNPGLNGVYTLRLTVTGDDGREATDALPVIVGRLAHTAEGGVIKSADGKARLIIPPLATHGSFATMALIPISQLEPDEDWRGNLPDNAKLLGEVYEIFPATETFRRPARLELPYQDAGASGKVGVLLGDGTREGWRYVGGEADAQRGVVSVSVTDFGSSRALAAVFASDDFSGFAPPASFVGTPPPPSSPLPNPTQIDPVVLTSTAAFAFYSDLEGQSAEWEALDLFGTQLFRVDDAQADPSEGSTALKVTRGARGERLLRVRSTPYDAAIYPILSFDYRMPPGYVPDLYLRCNGTWWQARIGGNPGLSTRYFSALDVPDGLVADDTWRHYRLDLLSLLRSAQPSATAFEVEELVLGQLEQVAYMQVVVVDAGDVGASYYLDNFAALAPTGKSNLHFAWSSQGAPFTAYSYALDQTSDALPPATEQTSSESADVALPPDAVDGVWYFHLRGKRPDGSWSEQTTLPVLVDRQAPRIGQPDPPPGGAGLPERITLPILDGTSGIDLLTLRVKYRGQIYGAGRGVLYNPVTRSLQILPSLMEPAPPTPANGERIEIELLDVGDYAGNKIATPTAWSFIADRPQAGGDELRRLTVRGGHSPALSPDGTMLAFVSARGGRDKIWLIPSDSYGEEKGEGREAVPLGVEEDIQADPAWSPDGKMLAFVSDRGGSTQVWVAAPDGTGLRALTTGHDGASSPTWLADSLNAEQNRVVFVRAGNLWIVNADGSSLRPLTSYPERPIRSVRALPTAGSSIVAVGFKLYEETVQLYDLHTRELEPLTHGGKDRQPAWLNGGTLLFTAPAGQGQPDAIWQFGADGSGLTLLPGSSQPGVADTEPATSADGSVLAITSTRGGDRDVWVRPNGQSIQLQVSPHTGIVPGETMRISFNLPTSATVTLSVEDSAGRQIRSLLQSESQSKGAHQAEWDGNGPASSPAAPGSYIVRLSAITADASVTRIATAEVVDARGTLDLEIEKWAGQPAQQDSGLRALVYREGTDSEPAGQSEADNNPSFKLPPGVYSVLVEYDGVQQWMRDISLGANEVVSKQIDLGLGGLELIPLLATGQPLESSVYASVNRYADPNAATLQTEYAASPAFTLPPGKYNVRVEYGGVSRVVRGLLVESAKVTRQEVNLDAGLLQLTVYSRDGELAGSEYGLRVSAYGQGDHTQAIATSYTNPAVIYLPTGRYDLSIEYGTNAGSDPRYVGGSMTAWLEGVEIKAGQTLEQALNLRLTPVRIKVEEAPGKPPAPGGITFAVYRQGDLGRHIAYVYTDTAQLELPEGVYLVIADYDGTELARSGPVGEPIEVKYRAEDEGRGVERTINLGLGHIAIELADETGQLAGQERTWAYAYPVGRPQEAFSSAQGVNRWELVVRANVPYDVVVRLDDGRKVTMPGRQVKEGETLSLRVNARDFKP